jgi:hypothetical protein
MWYKSSHWATNLEYWLEGEIATGLTGSNVSQNEESIISRISTCPLSTF